MRGTHLGLPPSALLARLLGAHARVLRRRLVDTRRGVERARHRPRRRGWRQIDVGLHGLHLARQRREHRRLMQRLDGERRVRAAVRKVRERRPPRADVREGDGRLALAPRLCVGAEHPGGHWPAGDGVAQLGLGQRGCKRRRGEGGGEAAAGAERVDLKHGL
ncbi:hypothetical protein PHLGIDRAFT_348783 [Phlebiopsis gigantea 11061_1 CR5-6]|uniref:Uncharacterized protein n=1 Tax=Phlebiopsis gigantea (strain 11061_1 CR5-6) TaxID=745531 RepID=A0A0C3NAM2_PHLG1|nr:hypothetical protein PHLGIDRAFT_348783 [Phlebiopsis gigantea 11061_1 CR5-6]